MVFCCTNKAIKVNSFGYFVIITQNLASGNKIIFMKCCACMNTSFRFSDGTADVHSVTSKSYTSSLLNGLERSNVASSFFDWESEFL